MVGCCRIQHQKNFTLLSILEMTSDIKTVDSTWLGGILGNLIVIMMVAKKLHDDS